MDQVDADEATGAGETTSTAQLLFNIAENVDGGASTSAEVGTTEHVDPTTAQIINIKQEITGESTMEITDLVDNANVIGGSIEAINTEQEGIPVSINEFVNFHNDQVTQLKAELDQMTKYFNVLYKHKFVCDMIVDEYFQDDTHFKYKNALDDLEADLVTVIGEDEIKYASLCESINTDFVLTEDEQLEFAEASLSDYENEAEYTTDASGNKCVQIINGVEQLSTPNTNIRKLPGQKSAEPPECPACGTKARCRLKLEAHILEVHTENPLVVCNHDGCEVAFELHKMFQHEKDYHPETSKTCEMCNENFETKSMLVQHYKLHIRKKDKLKCHLCEYTDIYAGRMDRHKLDTHGVQINKQFKCDHDGCGRVFKDRPSFYTHSLIHKDRSLVYKHKCTYEGCEAVFKRRRNLTLHLMKHGSNKRRFICNVSQCKRAYARERELARHIELVHRGGMSMEMKKEFEDSIELDTSRDPGETSEADQSSGNIIYVKNLEQNVMSTVNVISCEEMDVDGSGEHVIEMDDGSNTGNNKIMLLYNKGGEVDQQLELVSSNSGMMSEILCDEQIITEECELCSVKFNTPQEMISHLKERHHQYTIRAYRCDFEGCNFATHFRSILGKHKNTVHGGKYKCEVCGKLSKDSGNHNRHRNIHKNVVFRCRHEGCEAVYKSPKAYYVHVLTHSNEQPIYRCDFPACKYVTYYMNTLNVHKLTHSDVRNFFCPYENCGKGFKRNGDLNKHITHSHKGVKRPQKKRRNEPTVMFRCTFPTCGFTCLDGDTLSKHEDEHAVNSTERYKFEVVEEEV